MLKSHQIDKLRVQFARLPAVDPDGAAYARLIHLLDTADDATLLTLERANIRFVSKLAWNKLHNRGLR